MFRFCGGGGFAGVILGRVLNLDVGCWLMVYAVDFRLLLELLGCLYFVNVALLDLGKLLQGLLGCGLCYVLDLN